MAQTHRSISRKYRPQTFQNVLGQEAVVTTLKNAIRLNRLSHGYLFCGGRGTGKTTLARLFAKALSCEALSSEQEPCNQCQSCLEISSSQSLDIIEIDGASHRGIDDIRQINETATYTPASGRYKIYIIDEVHMLTKEAFNALLKTLEEPPSSILFLLATTEPHKIPLTILSRCQRFDLRKISPEKITEKLSLIASESKRQIDHAALSLLSSFAEGSLRDGESLLEQLFCYEEGSISIELVRNMLGLMEEEAFFQLDQAIDQRNLPFAFTFAQDFFQRGKDPLRMIESLIEHFRRILKIKAGGATRSSEKSDKAYQDSSNLYSEDQLLFILNLLVSSVPTMSKSPCAQVTMEMVLLQLIQSKNHVSLPTLVHRLVELEKSLSFSSSKPSEPLSTPPTKETKEVPQEKKKEETPLTLPQKHPSHYDTLLQFTAVELDGIIKK